MPLLKTVGSLSLVASLSRGAYSTGNFAVVPAQDYTVSSIYMDAGGSEPILTRNKNSFTQTSFGSVGFTMNSYTLDSQIVQELNVYVVTSTETRWYRLSNSDVTYEKPNTGNSYILGIYAHVHNDNLYVACRMRQVGASVNYHNIVAFKYAMTDTSITQVWGQNIYIGEGSLGSSIMPPIGTYDSTNNRFLIGFDACSTINGSTSGRPVQLRLNGTDGSIYGTSGYSGLYTYPSWVSMVNSSVGWTVSPTNRTNGTTTYKHTWTPTISPTTVYSLKSNSDGYVYFIYGSGIAKWNPFTDSVTVMSVSFGSIYSNGKTDWRIAIDDTYIYLLVPALASQGSKCGIFKFTKTFTFVKSMQISNNDNMGWVPKYHISVIGDKLYCTGNNILMSFNKDLTIIPPGQFQVTDPAYGGTTTFTLLSTITPTVGSVSQTVVSATDSLPPGSSATWHDSNPTLTLNQLQVAIKAT